METSLLIKRVRPLRFPEGIGSESDILVSEGSIIRIEKGIQSSSAECVDGEGCLALPGLVDMHVHLREPGREDEEDIGSGSRAAVRGGFTVIGCMPNTDPTIDDVSVAEYVARRGEEEGFCRVIPHGAISRGRKGEVLANIGEMRRSGARVKCFSDDGAFTANSEIMRRAMEYGRGLGVVFLSHAEDPYLTGGGQMNEGYYSTLLGLRGMPAEAEEIAVFRDIKLAEMTGTRLHLCHVTTAGALKLVREAKKRGVSVTCEVTPHHFSLDDSLLTGYDTNLKVNPPLRSAADVEVILEGLADGTVDVIATDHAPHAVQEKESEFDRAPFGMVGLETALGLVITRLVATGLLSLETAISKMTVAPASILGLEEWGYVPTIAEGIPANITVVNTEKEWRVDPELFESRSRNTPFGGWSLKGTVEHTVYGGKLVVKDGRVITGMGYERVKAST